MPSQARAVSRGSTSRNSPASMPACRTASTWRSYSRRRTRNVLGPLGGERRELVEEDPDVVGVAVDHVEQLVAQHRQLRGRRAARLGHPVGAEQHLVHHPVVDGGEQLLLRPDVVVERALAQPVDLAQLDDAGGVVALLGEDLRRGVDDRVATGLPLLAASGLVARSVRGIWTETVHGHPTTIAGSRGERAPLRRTGRGRHRRGPRHRPGLRPAARRARRERRGQRPRRLDGRRGRRRRPGGRRRRGDRRRRRRRPSPTPATCRRPTAARRSSTPRSSSSARIDVLVNNAGIIRWAGLPEVDLDNLERHLAVHVGGSFNTTRAAWPHLVEQGYGRIVMTTSAGLFGLPDNLAYATAKGGVIGHDPQPQPPPAPQHGIKVNLIAPAAMTRMAGQAPTPATTPRPDGAGAGRADGRLPRPRGLPGHRRDLRRRRRPLRPDLHRLDRGLRPRRRATRRSRTSPATGRRSTTSPATPSRPA